MRKIEGILFDLGDTLLDFGQVDLQGLFKAGAGKAYEYLQQQGLSLPSLAKYRRKHMMAVRWHVIISTISGREFNAKPVIAELHRKLGLSLTDAQLLEVCWNWYDPLHEQATVEPGLIEMLRNFRDSGLKLGIVSNTFIPAETLDRHLAAENLLEFFPVRIYSCEVGRRKPNKLIFDKALQEIGLSPEKLLFAGDSPRADIIGASRMGMLSVLKDPKSRNGKAAAHADHRVRSITELTELVARYNETES